MSSPEETGENSDRWSPSKEEVEELLREHERFQRSLRSGGVEIKGKRADFSGTDLSEVDLPETDLTGVFFRGADMSGIDLTEAVLMGADLAVAVLSRATLREADLSGAVLQDANLSRANLGGADLSGAHAQRADFSRADLERADLSKARLSEADLAGADLKRADLSEAKLRGADFSEAILWGADLSGTNLMSTNIFEADLWRADFSGASLIGVDLSGKNLKSTNLLEANLERADLSEANLKGVLIRKANLRDADLSDTVGLQVQQISLANISNANLPDDIAEFDGLKTVDEASRGARKLFITLILACSYSAFAIWAVEPANIEEESLILPFVSVNLGLWEFHVVVPVLLVVGFGYFHLQLQRVWEEISRLPAVFPDGKAIDQKIHPWLITGLVRAHFPHLRENPIPLFRLQKLAVIVLAWGTVPVTQAYFVGSFVVQFPEYTYHSGLGAALVALTTIGAVVSYQTARAHLRGEYEGLFRPFGDEKDESIRKQPNWHTVFLSIEWTLLIFALWIGWTFVL